MADRILIKNGIVLTQDPNLGELPRADVLIDGDHDRGRRAQPVRGRRQGHRRRRRHRDPGLHRQPPPHVGDVDPDVRPGLRAGHLLRLDPRQVRPALSARRRPRGQPLGRPRVHQRGHHDPRRLVAHHEHAGSRRRRDQGPSGIPHPVGLRLRLRQHLAPGLVVRTGLDRQRADRRRRRRASHPEAVLQLRRRSDHDVARDPWPGVLPAGRRAPRLGAGEGARDQHHGPCRDGPVRGDEDADRQAPRHGPAVPEHHLRPRLALHRRGVGARAGFRRQRLVRAPDRDPDGSRLGAGLDRDPVRPADRALLGRRHHGAVRPVHPDALDPRLGARPQAPAGVGRGPRRERARRRTSSPPARCCRGRRWAGPRSPGSPTGPARSRRARRPTSSSSTGRRSTSRRSSTRSGRWSARPTSRTSRPCSSTARSSSRTSSSRRRSTARGATSRPRATTCSRSSAIRSPAGCPRKPMA